MPLRRPRATDQSRSAASRWWCRAWRTPRPGDCDQPPAFGEPRQGRHDVPQGSVGHAAIDVGDDREWRVHQDNAWLDAGVEMIVDVRGVVARHRDTGKEKRKK